MSDAKKSARLSADLSLLVVTAIWGATFVMVKGAVAQAGPLTFVGVRFVLAALGLAPLLFARRGQLSPGALASGASIGLLLFAGYAFQTAGLQFTSASKAGFITGLSVVLVPLLSALVLRQPPSWPSVAGVGLATSGLALLSLQDDVSLQTGDLLVLGCALSFALHILLVGRAAPRFDVLSLTGVQVLVAALLSGAGALAFEAPTVGQVEAILPAALFTGLFATVLAFYVQTHAQRFTSATHTALIFTMEPVFAGLFGYLLAGERLGLRGIVGCGLILAGMVVAQVMGREA